MFDVLNMLPSALRSSAINHSSVGHTSVTIGYGGLRQVVATERKKVVQAVFLVTL